MDDAPTPIESIFAEALRLPDPAQRDAYLTTACHGDATLRARVDALLRAHEAAGSFMASSADAVDPSFAVTLDGAPIRRPHRNRDDAIGEQPGSIIGHYKLLQRIGEGGFGVVWMADQERPVRRRVALKVIKLGMDTKEVIARFEQERQALALMDHPNIARVLDAGATATGRPYFVMELVRGVKITEYCDEQNLSTAERIELFITVCQAVQHAHQKGIIHRDLKPSNILVTINDGVAVPKVIDFGVAKATQGRLTDGTLFTQFEQMIGTPLYMSPEQAEITSLDVDTRSDIYALGVLLYELLTGRTPIDTSTMAKAGMDEIRRLIREVDPPRPSTRLKTLVGEELTTVAKRRHTEPTKLPNALRGDIDWIVMKCLEKDRKRRYDTANGLAADLQRHLRNDVVVARPPTTAYLLSKLVRRNKLAFAATAAIAVSLLIGIAASVWQAVRATAAERRSVATLNELRASAPAFAEQARALASRERFDEAVEKLDYAIKLRPDVAEYLLAKADLLQGQLKLAEAAAIYRDALRVKPDLTRAEASAKLCDEVLAAPANADHKLTRESLAKLYTAMQQQQRPAAEMMPVARLLGDEKKLIVDYWLARLKDLPVSVEKPLKDRLSVRDDGRLALDLSDTKVIDLTPLAGAPLAVLNVSGTKARSELTDLSPLRGIDLVELNVSYTNVSDLSPLREMHSLEKLEMAATKVTDLEALSGLRLTTLHFAFCPVRDLNPIRKMPLEEMNLYGTRVADLSPLIGMPIKMLDLSRTAVVDFSPLAKLPLEKCYIQHCRITDLAVLRDRPLKELVLVGCLDLRNYAALSEIKTLELLMLPTTYRDLPEEDYAAIGALRHHPKLRQLAADFMNGMQYTSTGSTDVFWQDWDREQTFVPALRKSGIHFTLSKQATGDYYLGIHNQPLRDLTLLKGAPIVKLDLDTCPFSDLTPIHDLKLETLGLFNDWVTDLSPLQGMPLKTLTLYGNKIANLAPLKGLSLQNLYLERCTNVTDLSPLAEMETLEQLTVPIEAGNVEVLRKLTKLRMVAFNRTEGNTPASTAKEFWKDYSWISRWREAGLTLKGLKRLDDGTWDVDLRGTPVSELSVLREASISALALDNTNITDLEPLRGTKIKKLQLNATNVADLTPLKGMPLEELWLSQTKVTDLLPLRGMPLAVLRLHKAAELTDLSPLAECKELRSLSLPPGVKDFEVLRALPKLDHISLTEDTQYGYDANKTAKAFWNEVGQGWAKALRDAGINYTATKYVAAAANAPTTRPSTASGKKRKRPVEQVTDVETWAVTIKSKEFKDCAVFKGAQSIRELNLEGTAVSDLEPLRGMPLTKLNLNKTTVTDLGALHGMELEELSLTDTKVADLSALRGMALKFISLGNTRVADLEPLRGMPLKTLRAFNAPITDVSPLAGMPLEHLHLSGTKITDISVMRGMPLTYVRLHGCWELTDVSPLTDCKRLGEATLPPKAKDVEFFRSFPVLDRIGYAEDSKWHPDKTAAAFWKEYDSRKWTRALDAAGVKYTLKAEADGMFAVSIESKEFSDCSVFKGAKLSRLTLDHTSVHDLTPLRGMQITMLAIRNTEVSDLSPLAGMPLGYLAATVSKVADLSPLRGMPLKTLYLGNTAVSNLEPLRGMPLNKLFIYNTQVIDLAPIAGMPLEYLDLRDLRVKDLSPLAKLTGLIDLALPPDATDIQFLRAFPSLKRLSFTVDAKVSPDKSAAQFWNEYDGQRWLQKLREARIEVKGSKLLPDGTWDVNLDNSRVEDLSILRGLPISVLSVNTTKVRELAPLHGLPLKRLNLANCPVMDLSPLKGMPITWLSLRGTRVTDLSPLRGMPLTSIYMLSCRDLTDLSPLAECKELTSITLPPNARDIEFLRSFPKLKDVSFQEASPAMPDKTAEVFWKDYDAQAWLRKLRDSGVSIKTVRSLPDGTWELDLSGAKISDLTPIKGVPISTLNLSKTEVTDLSPLHGMPLKDVNLNGMKVSDISALAGMPLERVNINGTQVADLAPLRGSPLRILDAGVTVITNLEPLRGMKLEQLYVYNTKVSDLGPLAGMPLGCLHVSSTMVSDISVVRGMPLVTMRLHRCEQLTDLSPLAEVRTLRRLTLPQNAKDFEFLRQLPELERLSYTETTTGERVPDKEAKHFWQDFDAKKESAVQ